MSSRTGSSVVSSTGAAGRCGGAAARSRACAINNLASATFTSFTSSPRARAAKRPVRDGPLEAVGWCRAMAQPHPTTADALVAMGMYSCRGLWSGRTRKLFLHQPGPDVRRRWPGRSQGLPRRSRTPCASTGGGGGATLRSRLTSSGASRAAASGAPCYCRLAFTCPCAACLCFGQHAMAVCQISDEDQSSLLQIVAGILHLGNVTFSEEQNFAVVGNVNGAVASIRRLGKRERGAQRRRAVASVALRPHSADTLLRATSRARQPAAVTCDPPALVYPAYLLGIDADALNDKLIRYSLARVGRTVTAPLPLLFARRGVLNSRTCGGAPPWIVREGLASRAISTGSAGGRTSNYNVQLNVDQVRPLPFHVRRLPSVAVRTLTHRAPRPALARSGRRLHRPCTLATPWQRRCTRACLTGSLRRSTSSWPRTSSRSASVSWTFTALKSSRYVARVSRGHASLSVLCQHPRRGARHAHALAPGLTPVVVLRI